MTFHADTVRVKELHFGNSTADTFDVNLGRDAKDILKTDDKFVANSFFVKDTVVIDSNRVGKFDSLYLNGISFYATDDSVLVFAGDTLNTELDTSVVVTKNTVQVIDSSKYWISKQYFRNHIQVEDAFEMTGVSNIIRGMTDGLDFRSGDGSTESFDFNFGYDSFNGGHLNYWGGDDTLDFKLFTSGDAFLRDSLSVGGSLMANNYYSGDGTQGATSTVNNMVFKDGLYTSGTFTIPTTIPYDSVTGAPTTLPWDSLTGVPSKITDVEDASLRIYGKRIEENATNGLSEISINYLGYNGGTTQFRDLGIYDGKNNNLVYITGSTKNVNVTGGLSVPDSAYGASWNGNNNVPTKNAVYDKIEALILDGSADSSTFVTKSSPQVIDGTKYFTQIIQGEILRSHEVFDAAKDTLYNADDFGQLFTISGNTLYLRNSKHDALSSVILPSASVSWGSITGTLSSQTDLQNALDGKVNTSILSAGFFAADDDVLYAESGVIKSSNIPYTSLLVDADINSTVQAYDPDLTTYAGITPSANVQSILGAANYSAIRTLLSLGSMALIDNNFTANRVMVSNGAAELGVSSVTTTELGYLSGATSSIQTQIDSKLKHTSTDSIVVNADSGFVVDGFTSNIAQVITSITSNTITPTSSLIYWNSGSSGDLITLMGKKDGQELTIININTGTLTLYHADDIGDNLYLSANEIALGPRDAITLRYVESLRVWIQTAYSNN